MSIFGILIIIYFIFFFIKNRKVNLSRLYQKSFIFCMISCLIFDIGYFAKIGDLYIEYNYFFTIFLFLFSLYCIIADKIKLKEFKSTYIFIIAISISFLLNAILGRTIQTVPFNEEWDDYILNDSPIPFIKTSFSGFAQLIRIILFSFEFSVFSYYSSRKCFVKLTKCAFKVSIFVVLISMIEFVFYNFIPQFDFRCFLLDIFGHSESTYLVPRQFGGYYAPMAFMREPSSFAYMMFILAIVNISYFTINRNKKERKLIILNLLLILFLLIISTSFSAYLYLIAIMIIILLIFFNRINKFKITLSLIALGIIFYMVFSNFDSISSRFSSIFKVFDGEKSYTSNYIRLYSIKNNLLLFIKSPILGYGPGSLYCFSSIVTMLSNIGILGICTFVNFVVKQTNSKLKMNFFSFLSFFIILITHIVTGHMSSLIYSEKIIILYLSLKYLSYYLKVRKFKAKNMYIGVK